ncbi:unnamed protein product [Heterobilharzia americana]|nr:unnamed protein product [Heterobilharzia americana]
MNHTGIIPPIVNNQLYCNSWISIMNYCKMLLCSALSDELVYAKTLNSQNSTHFNRPLMEALLKLKTMIPDELINEVNEKDQSEYVENIDQLSGSSLTIDTDVSEHVNHELQLRRIQTIKEDLSWIRVKNESNKSTWYQITDTNKLGELLEVLTLRGVRERQLAKCIRRSKDFVELSMQVALKRNSEFDAAKCMSATRFNPQPFRIRSYRRRGRRSMRGHTRTNDVSLHNCTKSCNHKLLSEKGSRYFTTPSSWEASYSHDSKEIERPHSALSHSDLRYSDDCSSESNFGLTTTSSTYSKRNRMDIYNGYPYSPNKSLPDAVSVTNSKYRFVDDKKWQKDDTLTEEYVTFINECQLLCEVEALEDRVLCASLQIKGWTAPTKTLEDETIVLIPRTTVKQSPFEHWPIDLARSRLINIEHHLERRYLLPPLNSEVQLNVVSKGSTTELTLLPDNKCSIKECKDIGNETEGESDNMELDKCTTNPGVHDDNSQTSTHYQLPQIHRVINKQVDLNDEGENYTDCNSQILTTHLGESDLTSKAVTSETLPPGLINWRKNLYQASDVMTVRRSMEELIQAIAWDKSIMKVLCQICRRDNNEACLLLCDGCDRGYHTYCFRPQLSNIPSGDWFCYDCVSKATSKHLCYICGRCEIDDTIQQMNSQSPSDVKRMAICCHCSRAVHNSCARPTFIRIPKRWYCSNCIILKYSKLNHENCDLRLSKSRRKRKEYEDVADYSESNGNEKIKRRKICSVNNNTHTKTEDTSLEAYKTINKVDNTFLKQNQTRKYQGWWRKIHNYKKPNDTLDISNIPVNKSKRKKYYYLENQVENQIFVQYTT